MRFRAGQPMRIPEPGGVIVIPGVAPPGMHMSLALPAAQLVYGQPVMAQPMHYQQQQSYAEYGAPVAHPPQYVPGFASTPYAPVSQQEGATYATVTHHATPPPQTMHMNDTA